MLETPSTKRCPVVIGGVGGSGTRTVSELALNFGANMGSLLNPALDNLWFTFLFNRPSWKSNFPELKQQLQSVSLLHKATTVGLKNNATETERQLIACIETEFNETDKVLGAKNQSDIANSLLSSTGFVPSASTFWGWKEPNSHIFLPALKAYFPNLKYIHMVRNGLDMAYSNNQQQRQQWKNCLHIYKPYDVAHHQNTDIRDAALSEANSTGDTKEYQLVWQSLNYWISANLRAIDIGRSMPSNNFLLVNYENLCYSPVAESSRIAKFLDVDLTAFDLQKYAANIEPASTIGRHKDYEPLTLTAAHKNAIKQIGYTI